MTTGLLLQTLDNHLNTVNSVAFLLDSQKIVSKSNDKTVKMWDATTELLLQMLDSHLGIVNFVIFWLDGQKIVSGSRNKTIKV